MTEWIEEFGFGYLHPDWPEEFESFDHALHAFLEDSPVDVRHAFAAELRAIRRDHGTDEAALQEALEARGWRFFAEDGNTAALLSTIADVADRF